MSLLGRLGSAASAIGAQMFRNTLARTSRPATTPVSLVHSMLFGPSGSLLQSCTMTTFGREYQPNVLRRKRKHGFLARLSTNVINVGSTCTVYLATVRGTGRRVAVKRVGGYAGFREHAQREAAILYKLKHEKVLTLLGVVKGHDYVDLVLEYMDGGDILEWLDERSDGSEISTENSIDYLRQIASSLAYLHSVGICHGDVKAENVYLSGHGKAAKLGDFGLAYDVQKQEPPIGRCNPHTPPECLQGGPPDTTPPPDPFAADVFSLGVLVFCVLQGKFPWSMATNDDKQYAAWLRVQWRLMRIQTENSCACGGYSVGRVGGFFSRAGNDENGCVCGYCEKSILDEEEEDIAPEWYTLQKGFPVLFRLLVKVLSPVPPGRPTAETVFSALSRFFDSAAEKDSMMGVVPIFGGLTLDDGLGKSTDVFLTGTNYVDISNPSGYVNPSVVFDSGKHPSAVNKCRPAENNEIGYGSRHDLSFKFKRETQVVRDRRVLGRKEWGKSLLVEEGLLGSENDSGYSTGTSLNETEICLDMEKWAKGKRLDRVGTCLKMEGGVVVHREGDFNEEGNANVCPKMDMDIGRKIGSGAGQASRWDGCEEACDSTGVGEGLGLGLGGVCDGASVLNVGGGKSMQQVLDDWF